MNITHQFIFNGLLERAQASNGFVDIEAVAKLLHINLTAWELPKHVTSKFSVRHGLMHLVINKDFAKKKALFRFMAAHAIGHLAIGHVKNDSDIIDEMSNYRLPGSAEHEEAATRWGIELLAPQELARFIIKREREPQKALMEHFTIPQQVANFIVNQERLKTQ